jgi:endonuclease I
MANLVRVVVVQAAKRNRLRTKVAVRALKLFIARHLLAYGGRSSQAYISYTKPAFALAKSAKVRYANVVLSQSAGLIASALALLLSAFPGMSDLPAGYYASAENKTGPELRRALHLIIRGHNIVPYGSSGPDTSDALKGLDEDPVNTNNVRLLYAQRSVAKSLFAASGGGGWNREHVWPNSYGLDDRAPAHSDLHNLRAEDETVNSERANKLFDVSDTNLASYRFPAHSEALLCSTDVDSWEPPLNVRGDIARGLFYMDVRYEPGVTEEQDLVLTDNLGLINGTSTFMGRLTTLLKWHAVDPVDVAERLRNDLIFTRYQQNRNPFVDRPEWVHAVFAPVLTVATQGAPNSPRVELELHKCNS